MARRKAPQLLVRVSQVSASADKLSVLERNMRIYKHQIALTGRVGNLVGRLDGLNVGARDVGSSVVGLRVG